MLLGKTVSSMQCKEGVNASDGMALYRLQGGVDNCGTGAHPGAECHMECKDEGVLNEYLSGQRVIECGTNGEWSGPNLVCAERTTCNSSAISSNRTKSSLAEMGAPVLLSKKKMCAASTVSLGLRPRLMHVQNFATHSLDAISSILQDPYQHLGLASPVSGPRLHQRNVMILTLMGTSTSLSTTQITTFLPLFGTSTRALPVL